MFVSRNYGMSWVSTPIPETNYFTSYTAMSDNGEQIVTSLGSTDYSDQKPKIYRSVDSGTTWSLTLDLSSMSVAIQGMHSSPSGNIVKVFLQDTAIYTGTFPNTYTVTYAYNSATAGNETDRANFTTGGTAITLPTPTQTGYTFAGWYSDAGLTSKIGDAGASYSPSGSTLALSAYAKWTRNLVKAVSTVRPAITGTAKVSKTLTAKKGIWSGYPTPAFTYQWYACSKKVTAAKDTVPSTCKKISGATKSTLKLLAAQKGKFISVLVTGKGTGTSATMWLSKSTANVS
jgi:uncharacterized repeat protein (TIGR02543 family)